MSAGLADPGPNDVFLDGRVCCGVALELVALLLGNWKVGHRLANQVRFDGIDAQMFQ